MENEEVTNGQQDAGDASQTGVQGSSTPATSADIRALEKVVADSASDAAASVSLALADSMGEMASIQGTTGVVMLDDDQYHTLTGFAGASLHTAVFAVGFLALILGAVVGVALTLHWRGSRG